MRTFSNKKDKLTKILYNKINNKILLYYQVLSGNKVVIANILPP
jgi:hypothetical protein